MKTYLSFIVLLLAACSSDTSNEDASESCKTYCDLVSQNCSGENAIFEDKDTCFSSCALITDRPAAEGATIGDTLQCRIYHVGVAAANPKVHCTHASVQSTIDTCQDAVTACNTYCGEYFETCNADFKTDFGDTLQTCLNECPNEIPDEGTGMADDTTDTVNCRLSQLNKKNCEGGKVESTVCVEPKMDMTN